MALDFTLNMYRELLEKFREKNFSIISYEDFLTKKSSRKVVIMRHDVDLLPYNSYLAAQVEKELSARATYYFRIVKESNDPEVIKAIAELGHEIGYHYEDLTLADGDMKKAIDLFEKHLDYFRTYYPVKTICMHGSPMSPYDNRRIWTEYSYRNYNVIGEPYFDINFKKFLYLTDTGRRWNGDKVSVRDKISNRDKIRNPFRFNFRKTEEILNAIDKGLLPNHIMITTHPQRWHVSLIPWVNELVFQNIKNVVKKYFYVSNER